MPSWLKGRGLNVAALKSAGRAALVMPAVFALADQIIGKPQTSFLAAFGSFAMLVLVEFAGPWRARLLAYLGLGCVGAVNITLGTLCSRTPWIGAVVMALVGFVALFAGVLGGYLAAAAPAAILTFVLPVTLPAANSVVPDRLEGWGIAVGGGVCAVMLLWPPRTRADLSRAAAAAIRVVADFLDGAVSADEARRAVEELGGKFLGSQHRPTGPTGPTAALTSIPDELDWLLSFMTPTPEVSSSEDRDAIAAAAATLRTGASRLDGREDRPDFDGLQAARDDVARAVVRRLADVPDIESLDLPFRIRVATYSARQVAAYALVAAGADVPELQESDVAHSTVGNPALQAAEQVVVEHANVGSVWFQNAVRAAAGLGLAVYIAQSTGLQHGFWVVLGTLSVLRSNALSTGWSIVTALAGTAVGIVLGAALVIGIGTHQSVLWVVLPLAVLLASYAPRAISFAAGQAGFTVTLFILFNIIQPVGWRVGVVRVEDVAIGFAISLGVGLLFWPRGAAALLREQLADAFARGIDYVVIVSRELIEGGQDVPRAARAADAAMHRLDDAFRQYLSERVATEFDLEDVAAAVNAAMRVHRSAQSLLSLGRMANMSASLERCGRNLDRELSALQSWYLSLGYALVNVRPIPPPHIRDAEGRRLLLECMRAGVRTSDKATTKSAVVLLWTTQHLDAIWQLESRIAERVNTARAKPTEAGILGRVRLLRNTA
jgi:Fusaric acid resistance protein-like